MNMLPFGEINHPCPSSANWHSMTMMRIRVGVSDRHTCVESASKGWIVFINRNQQENAVINQLFGPSLSLSLRFVAQKYLILFENPSLRDKKINK